MFISDSFRQDILSNNTKIIPLVVIEKKISADADIGVDFFGFSTHNIDIANNGYENIYFKPLLLDLPKLKESIDIESGRYKISSVTLNFSNVEYNGSRMSDIFTNSMMINETVSIHLKSQSCVSVLTNFASNIAEENNLDFSTPNDCVTIYVGKIRDISHTDEKLTIRLEDLTESKMHKELPLEFLGDDESVPDKYKNKPIPMLYGHMRNAPLVANYRDGRITFQADYKEIDSVNEDLYDGVSLTESDWQYGAIKTYDDSYIKLTKYIQKKFVTTQYLEGNELNEEYVDFVDNYRQYYINNDNTISIENGGLWSVDRVQGVYDGKPSVVNLIRTNVNSTDLGMSFLDGNEGVPIEMIDNVDLGKITDNNEGTSINKEDVSPNYQWTYRDDSHPNAFNSSLNVPFTLRWQISIASAKFTRLIKTTINGYELPVKGFGSWGENKKYLIIAPDDRLLNGVANLRDTGHWSLVSDAELFHLDVLDADVFPIETYSDLSDLFAMSANHGNNENNNSSDWKTHDCRGFGFNYIWNDNAPIKFKTEWYGEWQQEVWNFQGDNPAIDCLPIIRFHEGNASYINIKAPDNYYCIDFLGLSYTGLQGVTAGIQLSSNKFHLDANINEIDFISLVEFEDATSKDYYGDVNGRIDTTISDEYLENPIHIMRHILKEECGVVDFDEDEYDVAVDAHGMYKFAFSVKDKINSKKLLEDISKNTQSYPRLKNNGKFGFVTLKRLYDQEDYESALPINNNDIIKYDFKLTDINKLISSIDVDYNYDFGSNSYLKKYTNTPDMTEEALKFYGIEDVSDNKITIESKHTNDLGTAYLIGNRKFYNNSAQHLIINMQLPLQYSEVEVGTVIKFEKDKLIDDMKAYGMDYTNPIKHGRSYRYPLFLITEVQRGLDSITISCYQLHKMLAVDSFHTNNHEFWNDDNFPNINLIDPALTGYDDTDDDTGGDDDTGEDDDFGQQPPECPPNYYWDGTACVPYQEETPDDGQVLGDVNLDGLVNVSDVVMLTQWILGEGELSQQGIENADFNQDGAVVVGDIIVIINYITENY